MAKIIFLIRSTPFQELNNYEAMRASIAFFDHEVTIAWMGDGVYYPLKTSDKSNTQSILRLYKDLNIRLIVDADEILQRGYSDKDIIPEVDPVPHSEVILTLAQADSVLRF